VVNQPMYVGSHWADIVSHICWLIGSVFWIRVILGFIFIQCLELIRRAKLIEVFSRHQVCTDAN
jgi:hypothetical protein